MVCRGLVGRGRVLTRMPEPGSPGSPCGESLCQSHRPDPRPPRSQSHPCACHGASCIQEGASLKCPSLQPKTSPSFQPPNLARHHFPLPGGTWRCRCQCPTLVPAGPWVPGGPGLPCGGQGDIVLGRYLLVAQDRDEAGGQRGPSTATPPCSLGGHLPQLTSPLYDSPLPVPWGVTLPEVLGVPALPGCPERKKRWGHCRDRFSPLGALGVPWERGPRERQRLW